MSLARPSLPWALALTGALMCAAALPAHATVTPIDQTGTFRIAGADRYATSVALSTAIAQPKQDVVYVASGTAFPDALTAGPAVAAAQAPLLLVGRDHFPQSIAEELTRLDPSQVRIVGGEGAVSAQVAGAIDELTGAEVTRIGGDDRYATAALLAGDAKPQRVFVASGETFADALAAGPVAALQDTVIVITRKNTLPQPTIDRLTAIAPEEIVVLGGEAAVSTDVEVSLQSVVPSAKVTRIAGTDRFETAAKVASTFWPNGSDVVFYASGGQFADALSGTPVAALSEAPILLTRPSAHPDATTAAAKQLRAVVHVTIGGEAAAYMQGIAAPIVEPPIVEPPIVTPPGETPAPTRPLRDLNCSDFSTWRAAQDEYERWKDTLGDVHGLDADKDGIACEGLPGAP